MNIWLKPIELEDGNDYCDLLIELARYENVFARPVPKDFDSEDFPCFKETRIQMSISSIRPGIPQTNTYWVMNDVSPIGYATLKHEIDLTKPGGHFGCCLKKEYQNKGIGTIVANLLSQIAYDDLGIEEVIYTSKDENIQSQRSVNNIGGTLLKIENGYHFYKVNIKEKLQKERGK